MDELREIADRTKIDIRQLGGEADSTVQKLKALQAEHQLVETFKRLDSEINNSTRNKSATGQAR